MMIRFQNPVVVPGEQIRRGAAEEHGQDEKRPPCLLHARGVRALSRDTKHIE
jgi:hypothetical protein